MPQQLEISLIRTETGETVVAPEYQNRPIGAISTIPARDGTYRLHGDTQIIVEMNPPDAIPSKNQKIIALTSELFRGHLRGAGYYGKERRLVTIREKKGNSGVTELSSYERLLVNLINTDSI